MTLLEIESFFKNYKEDKLRGRYIHYQRIHPLLYKMAVEFDVSEIGKSENNLPIHLIKLGTGSKRLLFWSQMHGNESTTTKAIFDFLNMMLDKGNQYTDEILKQCTLYIVPILSPDGALLYTRLNYNKVDLNRDAQDRSQKESVLLHDLIERVQPDVAFNLHGQRTIFSAGNTNKCATVSFLSPAGDQERTVTADRKIAMEIIVAMNSYLQQCIPNQVGRYDDGFNINCVGDTLANKGIPTILFEAGHYPEDYNREDTRQFIFYALISAVSYITSNSLSGVGHEKYFDIPENATRFYDYIIRNADVDDKIVDIALQYEEKLVGEALKFVPIIAKIGDLSTYFGHKEFDAQKKEIEHYNDTVEMVVGSKMLRFSIKRDVFSTELANY